MEKELYTKFQLSKNEVKSIIGGNYTSAGSDTNSGDGGSDITFETLDKNGENPTEDTMYAPH
ncbi:hypothetical protein [Zunongwangia profunda]|uniref:hypothetical protein n=1 Tax=Zunongwangia profunda TaxID=398743 RepID=UPI001D180D43|nr:hypothetical protein [Zunongwangia profunda]MCC4230061.1 hypothetical protein [Zunongwangia profunda]